MDNKGPSSSGRRGFLKGLLGGAPTAGILLANGGSVMPSDDFVQGGWRFRWIDYQQLPAMDCIYGLWIAEEIATGRLAHWSTRGRGDWHQKGNCFDLTGHKDWPDLDGGAPAAALRQAKRRAFLALRAFIHG